jgi:methionyl-tRNA formyltransferase
LEEQCLRVGGSLLVQAVQGMFAHTLVGRPQDEKRASYESYPEPQDYRLVAHQCSARQLYNFVHGVASKEMPVTIEVAGGLFVATDATFYSDDTMEHEQRPPQENEICIACQDGIVYIVTAA